MAIWDGLGLSNFISPIFLLEYGFDKKPQITLKFWKSWVARLISETVKDWLVLITVIQQMTWEVGEAKISG